MLALTSRWTRQDRRVVVCEVKRTRADLLADLRKKKMLKYEKGTSHTYLAATAEALFYNKWTKKEVLADLKKKGLPPTWGVLLLPENNDPAGIVCLRGAKKTWTPPKHRIAALNRKVARSYCYRALGGSFSDD